MSDKREQRRGKTGAKEELPITAPVYYAAIHECNALLVRKLIPRFDISFQLDAVFGSNRATCGRWREHA